MFHICCYYKHCYLLQLLESYHDYKTIFNVIRSTRITAASQEEERARRSSMRRSTRTTTTTIPLLEHIATAAFFLLALGATELVGLQVSFLVDWVHL